MCLQAVARTQSAGPGGIVEAAARIRFERLGAEVYAAAAEEEGAFVTGTGLVVRHEVRRVDGGVRELAGCSIPYDIVREASRRTARRWHSAA